MNIKILPFLFIPCACSSVTPFQYDNGDDYFAEGVRRVIDKNGKIGYENEQGEIVISPRFSCAFPFKNGVAKVADNCKVQEVPNSGGEYHEWKSNEWYFIDRQGNVLP